MVAQRCHLKTQNGIHLQRRRVKYNIFKPRSESYLHKAKRTVWDDYYSVDRLSFMRLSLFVFFGRRRL